MQQPLEITGGEAIARCLKAYNIGPMFGMGGFQLLPFYDAARRIGLNHNLINDERCAVFAADAYAKISGRVGVADATLGPGATNLLTGLVEAFNAGSPLVVLTGNAHREHAGKNMTQETRQLDMLRPAVKELLRVEMINRIPELMRRAFEVATSGRPGPVIVDVPEDICHATYVFDGQDFVFDQTHESIPAIRCRPDADAVKRAAGMLNAARRPLMLCGGGVHLSGACDAVDQFASELGVPVAHTMTGKGSVACTAPYNAGLFGRYDRIANELIEESDCLLVVGCKLGEIASKRYSVPAVGKKLIHLDIVAEEMGRTYQPTLRLWGDVRCGLEDIREVLEPVKDDLKRNRQAYIDEVAQRMKKWWDSVAPRVNSDEKPVSMARLLSEINRALPKDGYFIADGGFAAHWGGLLFDTQQPGRSFVPDRGFASIGYGLPGAMGAKLAAPDKSVIALTGDGGFNMVLGELETARRMQLAVVIVIVNNAASGYVKALQHLMYGKDNYQSSDLAETDYAAVAEAMDCRGLRVEEPGALAAALAEALTVTDRPVIVDVVVTRDAAKMLPAVDNRAVQVKKGDRVA